jgi:hypothetical protein
MSHSSFFTIPSAQRLARGAFWTLFLAGMVFKIYACAAEFFGIGLFATQQPWVPKVHMRVEVRTMDVVLHYSAIALAFTSLIIAQWDRLLALLGLIGFVVMSIGAIRY